MGNRPVHKTGDSIRPTVRPMDAGGHMLLPVSTAERMFVWDAAVESSKERLPHVSRTPVKSRGLPRTAVDTRVETSR